MIYIEFIFELIAEIILEGSISISLNEKFPEFVRYPFLIFVIFFFAVVIFGIFFLGIILIERNILISILFILVSLLLFCGGMYKFKILLGKHKVER